MFAQILHNQPPDIPVCTKFAQPVFVAQNLHKKTNPLLPTDATILLTIKEFVWLSVGNEKQ